MLSQDEIDALLRQNDLSKDEEDEINLDHYLSPFEQDALGEIGNISFGSASTALSQLLGQKVEITTPVVSAIYTKDLPEKFPNPHVAIHVNYTEGFEGTNLFVLKSKDAKIIADLMLGGTGKDLLGDELSEMDVSAVQEAMNQMMGSAATSMSTIFNTVVNISPPGVDILDIVQGKGQDVIPDEEVIIVVSFKMKIGDLVDSNLMQLITVPFAKKMIEKLMGTSTTSDDLDSANYSPEESEMVHNTHSASAINTRPEQYPIQNHQLDTNSSNQFNTQKVNVQPAQFSEFDVQSNVKNHDPNLGLLMDIPLQITVELGRTKKLIKEILELSSGSIIELDKLAGEPVDIFANNKLIAKGEVVVIDENFGVRITDIISQIDRVQKLQ
ncbi:flagellar motor switch phosphatase FliY [Vulcanibacillus modesticaldus]|uniref:Flagellar motor switch phosphatase FliY n=2 Tax=Vulcanibacillus modesticaldus TaxID=337097 RepID=A0A1D2YXT0_9BACI|nr:flagellar motor switch phosphatase FliY [Vulcanibacillus modesticaldus]